MEAEVAPFFKVPNGHEDVIHVCDTLVVPFIARSEVLQEPKSMILLALWYSIRMHSSVGAEPIHESSP